MSDIVEMRVISEERFVLGVGGEKATNADDVEKAKKEDEISELEVEQRKLKQIQSAAAEWMNSGSSKTSCLGMYPSPQEKEEADSRSVYVGNVDYSVTVHELEEHFLGCGPTRRVSIQCDKFTGRPKGFAYIEFDTKEGAHNALAMTDSLLKGRQIKVSEKRTNKPGISTSNRFPRGRGGFNGRARGGMIVKYVYPGTFPPHGRGMRRGVFSKNNLRP